MNLIEVACSIKPASASAEDDTSATLLGVTFLNKHCLVVDLAGSSQAAEQEPLLKRTFELKVQILQDMLGWQLLVTLGSCARVLLVQLLLGPQHALLPDGEWQAAVSQDVLAFVLIFALEWWLNDFVSIVACNRSNNEFTQRIRKQHLLVRGYCAKGGMRLTRQWQRRRVWGVISKDSRGDSFG